MFRRLLLVLAFTAACGPIPGPKPPTPPPAIVFDVVPEDQGNAVQGADVNVDGVHQTCCPGGVTTWQKPAGTTTVWVSITAQGYKDVVQQPVSLSDPNPHRMALAHALPPPPTRDEMLNVHITFQGLMVNCPPYGTIPWFEAAMAWASPECRANAYAAKHASTAWAGGDTHAIIMVPSGPPLYDEANQPYTADRFGPLDWTAGGTAIDGRLADLVVEVANAGFPRILLFLGGDGPQGYPIAMNQLTLVHDALANSQYGDLTGYVIPIPGWDGVFYGWEPSRTLIPAWGQKCRSLFPYCGLEHATGKIPLGEGDGDWVNGGAMRWLDLLLEEFDDDRYDDTVWQIAARVLGPAYRRPLNQPAGDDPGSPFGPNSGQFYLRQPTDRGPIVPCAFEFHEYTDVHSWGDPANLANTVKQREYLKGVGYTCGG